MRAGVDRLRAAVSSGERIAVYGDYDVDGATSTAIMTRFLRMIGVEARIYVPDRLKEGYGPNAAALLALRDEGIGLVCVVDSGTAAFEPLAAAKAAGLDCVVIDHHDAEDRLPEAVAVINPKRKDQPPGHSHLCAAGMSFIFCVAANAAMRSEPWYSNLPKAPDLLSLVDLAGLGTVCDVVPLVGVNRAFVRRGIELISRRSNPGIAALLSVAGFKDEVSARTCGYVLGPRVNAGGRIGRSDAGARLLSSDDPDECAVLAAELDAWNSDRRAMEKAMVSEAMEAVGDVDPDGPPKVLVVAREGWHEGVVGIAASRLKDAFDRPSFVFSIHGDLAKGSGRSMSGFDLGAAVIAARNSAVCASCGSIVPVPSEEVLPPDPPSDPFSHEAGSSSACLVPVSSSLSCVCGAAVDSSDRLLVRGGGHAMAAGVTLRTDRISLFSDFLNSALSGSSFAELGATTNADIIVQVGSMSLGLAEEMASLEPTGAGNPLPVVIVPEARVLEVRLSESGTVVMLDLEGPHGTRVRAKAFGAKGSPLAEALASRARGSVMDLVGTLRVNEFRGVRRAELSIEDARFKD
jgi:single-stranded-DNA-specific exonuclease